MARKDRSINVFSLSALDLFASAMGAFIIIAVMLFPYYLKKKSVLEEIHRTEQALGECKVENGELRTEIESEQNETAQVQAGLQGCREKLDKTFLALVMKWKKSRVDIDLHVVDPDGNRFYYKKKNDTGQHYPNSPAKLSVDTERGPGVEIWESPIAKPGTYKVYYKFYETNGSSGRVTVRTNLYFRDGLKAFPDVILREKGETTLVAKIIVKDDGQVRVDY